ncbi:hypothetical protein [Stenotrophomonas lactitubi]|uniref:hypothetical protein n=1 Tax=Stenotrophomonas lactitubi TaxID=2045214 RepID=UPI003208CF60
MGTHPHPHEGLRTLILCALLVLVMIMVLMRVQAVLEMATRLQARTLAISMRTQCGRLPAALSTQLAQALSDDKPLDPELRHALSQLALAWAAMEEAQRTKVLRFRSFAALRVPSQQRPSQ